MTLKTFNPLSWALLTAGLFVLLNGATVLADVPATCAADDPPVPAAFAPSYLAIGKDIRLKLTLVQRTLDDLALDAATRRQANQIVSSGLQEVDFLIGEMKAGRMPSQKRVLAVPANLRQARGKLMELLGPDQGEALQEKLRSLRGEARSAVAHVRANLSEMNISANEKQQADAILARTDADVEKLADSDLAGDEYNAGRSSMNQLLASTHDLLAAILSPAEQSQLGQPFIQLAANRPTTRNSQSGT